MPHIESLLPDPGLRSLSRSKSRLGRHVIEDLEPVEAGDLPETMPGVRSAPHELQSVRVEVVTNGAGVLSAPDASVGEESANGLPANAGVINGKHPRARFLIVQKEVIGNAEVARWGKGQYPLTARSIHFVLVYATALLRRAPPVWWDEVRQKDDIERLAKELHLDATLILRGTEGMISLIEQSIAAAIERTSVEIAETLAQTEVVLEGAGLSEPEVDETRPPVEFGLTTPLARRLLNVVLQADRLAGMIYVLWMADQLPYDAYSTAMHVKVMRPLKKLYHLVNDLHGYLCRRWPYLVKDINGHLLAPDKDPRTNPDLANPPHEVIEEAARMETRLNSRKDAIVVHRPDPAGGNA